MRHVVIVGAGQGGFQVATSLRDEGFEGAITLIGSETHPPYGRPALSKGYLADGKAEALHLRAAATYERKGITLLLGTRVEEIDRQAGELRLPDRRIGYDHLVLATGARNLRPPIEGAEHALDLRGLDDAKVLRDALSSPRRVAVVGGGFIGLEFAAMARRLGHRVAVAEAADRLMARVVSAAMSERFRALHVESGVELHLGAPAIGIDSAGVDLAGGTRIEADLVLLAVGVAPEVELADAAGLACDDGVLVDTLLLSSDASISALGDCARFPDPVISRCVRLESVQAATDHARHIARRLVHDSDAPYAAVPWFWSDQGGHKLQIVGFAQVDDDSLEVGDVVYRHRNGRITAVEALNAPRVYMKLRRAFEKGEVPTLSELDAAPSVDDSESRSPLVSRV